MTLGLPQGWLGSTDDRFKPPAGMFEELGGDSAIVVEVPPAASGMLTPVSTLITLFVMIGTPGPKASPVVLFISALTCRRPNLLVWNALFTATSTCAGSF